ncbi:MAG: glycosyltransferase [Candidatus Taylorbacteria bacterium]
METSPKIKILLVITKSNWGGAQRYVYDVATRLPKDRYDVQVIVGGNGALVEKLTASGIPVISVPELGRDVNPLKDFKSFIALFSLFRKIQPDIIHLNSSKIGAMGALAGRLARVPRIVFTAHGWAFNENRSLPSKIIIMGIYWLTLLLSHKTLTVSEHMKKRISSWPWVQHKIMVNYNAVEYTTSFSRENARLVLKKHNPHLASALEHNKRAEWIGTIAELHPIKGLEYAIRAVATLPPHVIYVIIGEGQERAHLEQVISELKLQHRVFLMGHIAHASEYLSAFNIFMLSSLSEGLAYVVLEAGIAGLPVVATAVGGIPEIIDDMESGILVQPKKARELGHALSFILEHPVEAKQYGATLKQKVATQFTYERMMKTLEEVYNGRI